MRISLSMLLALVLLPAVAFCSPVTVASYSMINGQAGYFSYMDTIYTNCVLGDCSMPYAFLSGGTGKLTDGVVPAGSWNSFGDPTDPPAPTPWVGWYSQQPSINFFFSQTAIVTSVGLYLDNTPGTGDVRLPTAVNIASQHFTVTPDNTWGPRWVYFNISPVTSDQLSVSLEQGNDIYTMLGEVSFNQVPEPAAWMTVIAGIGLLSLRRRRA
jgi:hypothetical protein